MLLNRVVKKQVLIWTFKMPNPIKVLTEKYVQLRENVQPVPPGYRPPFKPDYDDDIELSGVLYHVYAKFEYVRDEVGASDNGPDPIITYADVPDHVEDIVAIYVQSDGAKETEWLVTEKRILDILDEVVLEIVRNDDSYFKNRSEGRSRYGSSRRYGGYYDDYDD